MKLADVLRACRQGSAEREANEALADAGRAVLDTSKSATVTITLTFIPMGGNRIKISDKISTKKPELTKEDTLFFLTEDGLVTRKDPRQMTLEELQTL